MSLFFLISCSPELSQTFFCSECWNTEIYFEYWYLCVKVPVRQKWSRAFCSAEGRASGSCTWWKAIQKKTEEPFSNGYICASHRELQLLARGKDRNSVTALYFFNMKNYYTGLGGSSLRSSLGCKPALSHPSSQLTVGKSLAIIFIKLYCLSPYNRA